MKIRHVAAAALLSMTVGFPMGAYAQNAEVTAQIQAASGDLDAMIDLAVGLAEENPGLLEQIVADAISSAPGDEAEVAQAFAESFPDSAVQITSVAVTTASNDAAGSIAGAVAAVVPDQAQGVAVAAAQAAPEQAGVIVASVSEASGAPVTAVAEAVAPVVGLDVATLVDDAENQPVGGESEEPGDDPEPSGSDS